MNPPDLGMTPEAAGAWVMIISALGAAIASVIAAWKATKASANANAAKNQAALNHQTAERTERKLDENTKMTAELKGTGNGKAVGEPCSHVDCPRRRP